MDIKSDVFNTCPLVLLRLCFDPIDVLEETAQAMRYRRRSSLFKINQNKEYDNKSCAQLFAEFLHISSSISCGGNGPPSPIATPQSASLGELQSLRLDYLKNMLFRLKDCFNPGVDKLASGEDKSELIKQLVAHRLPLATALTLNIIQPPAHSSSASNQNNNSSSSSSGSNQTSARLFSMRLVLYLSHLAAYHVEFESTLGMTAFIVRQIDLDTTADETALCIEYIRIVCQLYPHELSVTHVRPLLALVENYANKINCYALETLLEVACKRPRLACQLNVFGELLQYVLNMHGDGDDWVSEIK